MKGGIGKVNSVRLRFSCWYPEIENAWRQNKEQGGGDLYLKQLSDFTACVDAQGYDYFYADRAVRIQQIVDKIYAEKQ